MSPYYTSANTTGYTTGYTNAGYLSPNQVWQGWTNTIQTTASNAIWDTWTTNTMQFGTAATRLGTVIAASDTTFQDCTLAASRSGARPRPTEATRRAQALLLDNLSRSQRSDYRKRRTFRVRCASGRRYEIIKGQVGNVFEIDQAGRRIHKWCGHPQTVRVPDEDAMLAQKLMLETDEEAFLRLANRHW